METQALKHALNQLLDSAQFATFAAEHAALLAEVQTAWQQFQQAQTAAPPADDDSGSLDSPKQESTIAADVMPFTSEQEAHSPADLPEALDKTILPPAEPLLITEAANPAPEAMLGNTSHQNQHSPDTMPIHPSKATTPPPAAQSIRSLNLLHNAQEGKAYETRLSADIIDVQFRPDCGLLWDSEEHRIHGTPNLSGDVQVDFYFADRRQAQQKLYINPNPQSLWKNLPSDPQGKFAKTDSAHAEFDTAAAALLAARLRGRSHAHVGSFCDDDIAFAYFEAQDIYLLTVSDGAGSAAFSREGSRLAVNAVRDSIGKLLADTRQNYHRLAEMDNRQRQATAEALITVAAYQALAAHHQALDEEVSLKSLSCTLLIALVLPLQEGGFLSLSYWVGDGAIGIYRPETQEIVLMGESDSGAYSGETRFLAAEYVQGTGLQQRIYRHISEELPLLLLMSDGVSDPKFETEAQLAQAEHWQALWQELQTPLQAEHRAAALEEWLHFWSPGNHDDRSIALLVPKRYLAATGDTA